MSLFMPKEEGLPIQLGASVPRPTAPIPDEWKCIGIDLYAHRDTGMLKFTPPEPTEAETAKPSVKPTPVIEDNKWHSGEPPSIGWWVCSKNRDSTIFRFWDGDDWSRYVRAGASSGQRARAIGNVSDYATTDLDWRFFPAPPWGRE